RPAGPVERAAKWARRRPLYAALLALSIVAVFATAGGVWLHVRALRREVAATKAAEKRADDNARDAAQRRDVALRALDKLIVEVQEELRDRPDVAHVRERLLKEAIRGLNELAGEPDARSVTASQTIADLYFEMGGV